MGQYLIRMSSGRIKNAARSIGVRGQVSGIRKLECGLRPVGACAYAPAGMRKIRKTAGRMLSIKSDSFRARARSRPRNQNFIGDEERGRGRARRSPYAVTACGTSRKHEIYLVSFSCFRPFVINLSFFVPACPG